jgi:hypothetical protein
MLTNKNKFLLILVAALVLVWMVVPAQAATWDSTTVFHATSVTKYDVAVGNKLKGASDDTVRIVTTQSASPYRVILSTDRSTALPMVWSTDSIYTDVAGNRGCAIGDVDGDGQNEIIIGRAASPYGLRMIKWSGSAWVTTVIFSSTLSVDGIIYDIAIGDADNNIATPNDIVFTTGSYGVKKARWNGATFDTTRLLYNTSSSYFSGVAIGDFDNTYAGNEIVAVTYNQYVYRIRWTGAAWDATQIYYNATDYDYYDVAVGDFDNTNPGAEIAINNGYNYASGGAVQEVYGSGATWAMRNLGYNPSNWGSWGEIAVGDFYSGNPGAEIVAVSGSGSAYEARLVYGSGTTWYNEKIMGTGSSAYGVATGNLNRYRTGDELAVGGNYKVWEAQEKLTNKDLAALSIDGLPTTFHGGDVLTIKYTIKNLAQLTAYQPIPVKLRITGPSGYTYSDIDQNTLTDIAPLGTEQITFSPNWTIPATAGVYTIKAWSEYVGDEVPANDTVTKAINVLPANWVFFDDFEGCTPPAFPAGYVVRDINGGTTWLTDASNGMTGNLKCAKYPYSSTFAGDDWFFTPGFSLQAGLPYKLDFYYKSGSASYIEKMNVFLGTSQLVADTLPRIWDNSNITNTTYAFATAVYSPSVTQTYYLGFHCYSAANQLSLYVDSILVYSPPPDMAAITIDNVPNMVATGSVITVKTTVKNFSTSVGPGVPVKMKITGPGGYVYNDVDQVTQTTILPGGTEQIVFSPDWTVPSTLGSYTIKAWTEYALDQVPGNDTVTTTITVARAGGLMESFTGTTFPPAGWTRYNFDGGDQWIRYTTFYNSPPACAEILYDYPNNDWLITPRLRVVTGDELRFWWRAQSTSYTETLYVRASTNPDISDTGAYAIIGTYIGNTTTFAQQVIDLSPYAGKGDIYIAFHYPSYNKMGVGVDDVSGPYFPPKIQVTPDSIYAEGYVDSFFDVFFNIANIGGGNLTYSSSLSHPASFLTIIPMSGSVASGATDTDTLRFDTHGLAGHYYDTLVVTSNSGEKSTQTLLPIHLYVRMIPNIVVSPDSLAVPVVANDTKDTAIIIGNTGNGELNYAINTEEWSKFGVVWDGEPATRPHRVEMDEREQKELLTKGGEDPRRGTPPAKGMGGPDAFGYRWIDSDESGGPIFSWIEINATGTQVLPGDDGNVGPFPIGFPFEFYGTTFDSFRIAANGFATFTSTSGTLTNDTIPSPPEPNNLLALMWDDLRPASGGGAGNIYFHSNSSRLVIEYDHVIRYGQTACPYTMEIILYPNGQIFYEYLQMGDGTCTYLNQSTIGIENGTGTDGLEVVFNANYVHDNLAIRFSAAPAWLVFSPESGVVPAYGSDTVDVTFDATGILGGDFYGAFIINSDDPDTPVDTVPAHMHVVVPDMTFSPASIETSGTEGQAPFNATMNIGNAGEAKLIFSIVEGVPWLSVSPLADTIMPGDPATPITLTIDCTNLYAGNYQGQLKIYSNDPDFQPYATYNVALHVGPNPDIAVNPESFDVGVYGGYTKDTTMTISNTGDGHLVWGITIEELGRKGSDTTLYEGFEGTFPPAGWTVVNNDGGTQTWVQYSSSYHTGLYSAACRWESSTLWNDDWLITPRISVGSNDSLSFWYMAYSTSFPESLEVRLSTTTNDVSAFTTLLWAGSQLVNLTWEEKKIELGKYSRGKVYIAFVYKGLDEFRIMVDDVCVQSYAGPWLTVDPMSGVINPGKGSQAVKLSFSAIGYEQDMDARLWITSNDPDESPVYVPVHMAILGPNYSVSPPETLVIDALEDQYTDGHVYMENYGGHAPLAYKMTDPEAWLSESPDTAEVPIDSARDVTVTVDGNLLIAGDYATKLFIKTNDFNTPEDTLVVIVHVGPPPDISVAPDSFRVQVLAGGTKDTAMTVYNDGDGHLGFALSTEETGPKLAGRKGLTDRDIYQLLNIKEPDTPKSSPASESGNPRPVDTSNPAQLTVLRPEGASIMTAPGSPLMATADEETVFVQLPHDPSDTWSFATSDQGAGYKTDENFWGVALPVSDVHFWGLCLKYSGGWVAGNPNNLVFDITFYSDPPNDPTLPPNQVACTYQDIVPTVVPTGIYFTTSAGTFEMYFFTGIELAPICNLTQGWVSIQSKSAGTGYDWFLWASAKTGDVFSYQENGTNPRYYDQALILTGGLPWFTVAPEADTVNPHSSVNVNVHFDATQIMGGEKLGNIIIESNDPDESPWTVPVHMIVGGAQYVVDSTSMHINALEDQIVTAYLTISNPGGQGPLSYKMTDPVTWLSENPDSDQIPPDGQLSVAVRVNAEGLIAGNYSTEIMVKTNAVNQQYDTIPIYVYVGPDAEVDIAPMSLNVGVIPGYNRVEKLRVNNLSGGHLGFVTEIGGAKGFLKVGGQGTINVGPAKLPPADAPVAKDGTLPASRPTLSSTPNLGFSGSLPKQDVILSEDFEDGWPPPGWTVIQNSTDNTHPIPCWWSQTNYSVHSGVYAAGLWWSYYYQDEWLITPEINIPGACTLSFWTYGYEGSTNGDHYYVEVSTDGGSSWTPVFDLSTLSGNAWNQWAYPYYIDLSAYAGQDVKIAWYAQDPPTDDGIWYLWIIDDITLTSYGPGCPFTVEPEADTLAPHSFIDLLVTFDGTAFEPASLDTLRCNLLFYTNDPDEALVTVPVTMWSSRGDLTGNGVIDIEDVIFLLNFFFAHGPEPIPMEAGDVNYDLHVDSDDALFLVSYLFLGGPPPEIPLAPKGNENIRIKTSSPIR